MEERKPDVRTFNMTIPPPAPEDLEMNDDEDRQLPILMEIRERLEVSENYNKLLERRIGNIEKRQETFMAELRSQMILLGEVQKVNLFTLDNLKNQVKTFGEIQKAEFEKMKETLEKIEKPLTMTSLGSMPLYIDDDYAMGVADDDVEVLEVLEAPAAREEEPKCIFCDDTKHDSADCRKVTNWMDRRNKLLEKKICLKCLEPTSRDHECSHQNEECPNCTHRFVGVRAKLTNHHPILCYFKPKELPTRRRASGHPRRYTP